MISSTGSVVSRRTLAAAFLALGVPFFCFGAGAEWKYPVTKRGDAIDTYFGKNYPDPYRWLEAQQDAEPTAWFKAQAELTDGVLAKIPAREKLAEEWLALDRLQPATYRAISFAGGRLFYKKALGGENVAKLYYRDGWDGAEKLLFDPGTYKAGVVTTIQAALPSHDGRYVAIGLSSGGAEFQDIRILDVEKAAMLAESYYPSYGPLAWTPDNKALIYDGSNITDIKSHDIELNRQSRLHMLGTDFAGYTDIFSNQSHPELNIEAKEFAQVAYDEASPEYMVGSLGTVQNEFRFYVAPVSELKTPKAIHWTSLCQPSDQLVRGFAIHGDYAYAVTYAGAPQYKLVRTKLSHPDWKNAEVVIPEAKDAIQYTVDSKNFLLVVYSDGILGRAVKYDFATGQASPVVLPLAGNVDATCPDPKADRFLVEVCSWLQSVTRYSYEAGVDRVSESVLNTAIKFPGYENLVSEEVEVRSHDGVMVPLSIIHRKDIPMDGSSCCIMEGYGAYGYSYTPYPNFRDAIALHGVVVAYPHVRGGSEKGEAWYRGGFKTTKPNTWKDFIACAEYLVEKKYTSPAHLGGTGTSAGGILISRAITERPDLFAAAVVNVGCANSLRLEFASNGPVNTPEFGTVKDQAECAALAEMDGLSHVQAGVKYPAILGVGGWNDPRVPAWQPGKFVAATQAASASGKPVLLKINYDNGHFTEEKSVTMKNFAGQYAFMLWQSGHPEFQPRM